MTDVEIMNDAALMHELRHSPAWTVILKYLKASREDAVSLLTDYSQSADALRFHQGRVRGLDKALTLPESIIAEAKRRSQG